MPFHAIFFDLDDTLCDETGAWRHCTRQTAQIGAEMAPNLDADALMEAYLEHSDVFWRTLDPTNIPSILQIRAQIWQTALRASGCSDSDLAQRLADDYGHRRRTQPVTLFPEAVPLLTALRLAGKTLVLITNGIQETHLERIASLGLEAYFHHTLIADAVGFAKPDPRIYHHALRLADCAASEAAMIGDNPHTDIAGAEASGITSFWYNPHGRRLPPDAPPPSGGEVGTLSELVPVLSRI